MPEPKGNKKADLNIQIGYNGNDFLCGRVTVLVKKGEKTAIHNWRESDLETNLKKHYGST